MPTNHGTLQPDSAALNTHTRHRFRHSKGHSLWRKVRSRVLGAEVVAAAAAAAVGEEQAVREVEQGALVKVARVPAMEDTVGEVGTSAAPAAAMEVNAP